MIGPLNMILLGAGLSVVAVTAIAGWGVDSTLYWRRRARRAEHRLTNIIPWPLAGRKPGTSNTG